MRNKKARACLGAVAVLMVAGCSNSEPEQAPGPGWAAEFAEAREKARESEFARAALADDRVTDAELAEANSRLVDCLDAAGFPGAVVDSEGGLTVPDRGLGASIDPTVSACEDSIGWSSISILYRETRRNPENIDPNELIAACLVRHEVVPVGYSGKDYADAWDRFVASGGGGDFNEAIDYVDSVRGPEVHQGCEKNPSE
ncbi:MAG: hypothetical protein QM713_15445 [Arachnia sp.]